MKRIILLFGLIAALCAGCGTSEEQSGKAEKKQSNAETVANEGKIKQATESPLSAEEIAEQARYTFLIKQNHTQYGFHIFAEKERKSTADEDWACANKGDDVYTGDYKLAVVKKGGSKPSVIPIGHHTFQVPNDGVGVIEGDPSLLVVSHCEASDLYSAQLYTLRKNGKPIEIKDGDGKKLSLNVTPIRIKAIGKNTYQSAVFSNAGETDWVFYNWILDREKWQLTLEKKIIPAPGKVDVTKWSENPNYIVE
ncbi:hypothetical protein QR721_12560 [Aciduricibacillus chroicocephali]|uniref:Lipoprotein n=1 Tax=Aciduricibacillus chroicocephali TaxID=3054939 RepID=A0ABY9KUH5_9BACI|nr:hypothetical protein QR721_12560 [Bacillaceae bacterium 44XB]